MVGEIEIKPEKTGYIIDKLIGRECIFFPIEIVEKIVIRIALPEFFIDLNF
jgi:hypothetical protein